MTHKMAFKIDIFDNEWRPLIKLFNRAMAEKTITEAFNADEMERLETFIRWFKEEALEKGGGVN